ncbi:methyltransferase [bacterium]|nr:methyltransferase [bacterium]
MSRKTELLGPAGAAYLNHLATIDEPEVHARLRSRTSQLPDANMQISPEQGRLLGMLVQMLAARRILEIGVFTGYSALCMAERLADDGRLVACDVSREYTDIARPFWQEAGVDDRIDLRLGPAVDTLMAMVEAGETDRYDLAFIDADKENNERYYELCLDLLRPGGLVAIDNTFADGTVFAADTDDPEGRDARMLNEKVHRDRRVDATLIAVSDGLLVARKR